MLHPVCKFTVNCVCSVVCNKSCLYAVDNAKPCPVPHQQQQSCQHLMNSGENTDGYSNSHQVQQQPVQNQAFGAQSQYYSSPGSHSQMLHGALTDFNSQQHHAVMRSPYSHSISASVANEHSSPWQQSASSVNHAHYTSQYCGFADQRQAVMGTNRQRVDHDMRLKQQLAEGFETGVSMQHGCVDGQQSSLHVTQNQLVVQDCETYMKQSVNTGADRQKNVCYMYQQPDTVAGFAGQQPRPLVGQGQHLLSVSPQSLAISDAFTSCQNSSVIQPNESLAMQQQQQVAWSNSQSNTQTGCCIFLTVFTHANRVGQRGLNVWLHLCVCLRHNSKNKLETKAMPLLRQCNIDRMCFPLPITTTEKTSLAIHVVQKITRIRSQKIGKSVV